MGWNEGVRESFDFGTGRQFSVCPKTTSVAEATFCVVEDSHQISRKRFLIVRQSEKRGEKIVELFSLILVFGEEMKLTYNRRQPVRIIPRGCEQSTAWIFDNERDLNVPLNWRCPIHLRSRTGEGVVWWPFQARLQIDCDLNRFVADAARDRCEKGFLSNCFPLSEWFLVRRCGTVLTELNPSENKNIKTYNFLINNI